MANPSLLYALAVWTAVVLCAGLAVFQLGLTLGAPWGALAWGGRFERLPRNFRFASGVAVGIFLLGGVSVLERAGVVDMMNTPAVAHVVVWGLAGLAALSTLSNLVSPSRMERLVMTPVALLLAIACATVALGTP